MCFYFLDNRFTSEFPDRDVVEFPIPSVPNQRLVLAVLLDDRGNQFESGIGFRLCPPERRISVVLAIRSFDRNRLWVTMT